MKQLHKRVTDNKEQQIKDNERTQKHILGCSNFKLRDGAEGLLK